MKKNIAMRVASLILMCTIVTSCFVGSTFAKYTSSVSGTSTAVVAKWLVKVGTTDVSTADQEMTFNIFDKSKIYDLAAVADTSANASGWTKTVDADVKDGTTNAIVAPGTWGEIEFAVSNESDVTVAYSVVVSALTTTLPLEFSTNGTTWVPASDISADLPYSLGSGSLAIGSSTPTNATAKLYWRWTFERGADAADTALGHANVATCNITAGVTFTQAD